MFALSCLKNLKFAIKFYCILNNLFSLVIPIFKMGREKVVELLFYFFKCYCLQLGFSIILEWFILLAPHATLKSPSAIQGNASICPSDPFVRKALFVKAPPRGVCRRLSIVFDSDSAPYFRSYHYFWWCSHSICDSFCVDWFNEGQNYV